MTSHVARAERSAPPPPGQRQAVVALVPADRINRLAAALPAGTTVRRVSGWPELRAAIAASPAAAVIDPLLLDAIPVELDRPLFDPAGAVPLIVYTTLASSAMHRLLEARSLAGARLVLAGVDDGPEALRHAFRAAGATAHRLRALAELRACTGPLPRAIDRALADLLGSPAVELTVQALADAACLSPRTLERRLADAGAPSARWLVRKARALLARELLCSSPLTVAEVARDVGYAKLDSLRALLRWSFNSSPTSLRHERVRLEA